MKSMIVILLLCAVAYSQASVWPLATTLVGPANPGAALVGPATHVGVKGPDGSHIAASAQAGVLNAAPIAGGVVSSAVSPGVVAVHGSWGSFGWGGLGHGAGIW